MKLWDNSVRKSRRRSVCRGSRGSRTVCERRMRRCSRSRRSTCSNSWRSRGWHFGYSGHGGGGARWRSWIALPSSWCRISFTRCLFLPPTFLSLFPFAGFSFLTFPGLLIFLDVLFASFLSSFFLLTLFTLKFLLTFSLFCLPFPPLFFLS